MPEEEPEPQTWDDSPSSDWVKRVDTWTWNPIGGGDYAKHGKCHRCKESMSVQRVKSVFATLHRLAKGDLGLALIAERGPILARSGDGKPLYARCNCSTAHPGRPPELKTGCGAWGYIGDAPDED